MPTIFFGCGEVREDRITLLAISRRAERNDKISSCNISSTFLVPPAVTDCLIAGEFLDMCDFNFKWRGLKTATGFFFLNWSHNDTGRLTGLKLATFIIGYLCERFGFVITISGILTLSGWQKSCGDAAWLEPRRLTGRVPGLETVAMFIKK